MRTHALPRRATTFTIDFYRAFLEGNKLESALHIARRNLASKGGDWSVFALFTDPDRLNISNSSASPLDRIAFLPCDNSRS